MLLGPGSFRAYNECIFDLSSGIDYEKGKNKVCTTVSMCKNNYKLISSAYKNLDGCKFAANHPGSMRTHHP